MTLSGSTLEAGVVIGDFRIERRLGAGGMGIVYQARQLSLNRPVALKVLGQALTRTDDVTRFQREAQAAARLRHPAIAQVFFIGQDRHICYLAMELIDGVSMRRVIDRVRTTAVSDTGLDSAVLEEFTAEPHAAVLRFDVPTEAATGHEPKGEADSGGGISGDGIADGGVAGGGVAGGGAAPRAAAPNDSARDVNDGAVNPYMSPVARDIRASTAYVRRCCELIRDAADALAHAHEQGVVHRDIKPDNLLLDRSGRIHVIDFGVARFFDDQAVTYTGQLVGTPLYMSPEQVSGRGSIDRRTDVFSLGLVLYELLTLRTPVEAGNREHLLRTILTKPLPPVTWRNAAVPADLERIVHRATQKDPDDRYASARDLAADLEAFLFGKPVSAPPYRFRFDEREIIAARPGSVVLSAFVVFMVSAFVFMSFASFGVVMGIIVYSLFGLLLTAGHALAGCGVLAGGIVIGRNLLRGREWARWLTVIGAAGLCLFALGVGGLFAFSAIAVATFGGFENASPGAQPDSLGDGNLATFPAERFAIASLSMYLVPCVMGVVMGVTAMYGLLTRAAGDWFRFAWRTRQEYQRLKAELS